MPKCVLLVDDSPVIRSALRTMVESAGIAVCGEAGDGAQAIEKAKQLKPDLIVLDFSTPVMNGLQAAPILKGMLPNTPSFFSPCMLRASWSTKRSRRVSAS